jgi:8-oxo-dGTP pyrophosphatase MutT (NUDIX family)
MEKGSVMCIIENDKEEILLQKKTLDYKDKTYPGYWCFFGGQPESDDLFKEMNRELEEEIGIKLNVKFLLRHDITIMGEKVKANVFIAKLNDLSKIKIGEGAGVAFFGKEELKKLPIFPDDRKILNKYFKEYSK